MQDFFCALIMKIDVNHIAKLANLPLTNEEKEKFAGQLSSILDYFTKLNELDTAKIEPTSQVTGLENVTREDKTQPSLSQDEALASALSKHNGLFKVKAVLEE